MPSSSISLRAAASVGRPTGLSAFWGRLAGSFTTGASGRLGSARRGSFSADDVPASIAFLIDSSNSMRPNRERVIAAAVAFAESSHPRDEISVLTFNEAVSPAFGPAVIENIPEGSLRSAMDRAITARGMTAVYDGVLAGLERVSKGAHTRQVLILVSDGDDNASRATRDEVIERVRQSDATIYAVALLDPLLGAHAAAASALLSFLGRKR